MVSDPPKPSWCPRLTLPQVIALAAVLALAVLAVAQFAELPRRPPAPVPSAPVDTGPVQPLVMPLQLSGKAE